VIIVKIASHNAMLGLFKSVSVPYSAEVEHGMFLRIVSLIAKLIYVNIVRMYIV
jgi:hypothetical protein